MKKILIVEDEFHLRKNIKELLTRHNYEPLAASTLSEAMHYVLNQKDIALFLLDVCCRTATVSNCAAVSAGTQ